MKGGPPLPSLSDEELQARIERFARLMLDAQERFQRSKDIADRAERDRWWIAQKAVMTERARRRRVTRAVEEEHEIERLKEENAALRRQIQGRGNVA